MTIHVNAAVNAAVNGAANVAAPSAASGIRVLNERGTFGAPVHVSWATGRFSFSGESAAAESVAAGAVAAGAVLNSTVLDSAVLDSTVLDGSSLWMVPGLVDAHAHVSWHAFNADDRANTPGRERDAATEAVLGAMFRAGFTSVRDAGGFEPRGFEQLSLEPRNFAARGVAALPRVQASVAMIGRESADAAGGVLAATEDALSRGARWIKLIGTASVASPPGSGLEPLLSLAEQRAVVDRAAEVGAGVMLHAWGGPAIDHAIDAGVMSIEHGIFLTEAQAKRAADAGMTLVPTLLIYQHVRRMISAGALPASFAKRVDEALAAHPASVRRARDAGLAIALGTDFSTPEQHGTNRAEFDALVRAGLTPEEAIIAATTAGARLLARAATPASPASTLAPSSPAPSGLIAEGEIADAVLFNRDPLANGPDAASAFSDPRAIAAVIMGGRYYDFSSESHPRKDTP